MAPNASPYSASISSSTVHDDNIYQNRSACLSRIQELKKINEIKPLMVNRGHLSSRRCILMADALAGQIDQESARSHKGGFMGLSNRQLETLFKLNLKYTSFVANIALRKLLESADDSTEAARLQARAKTSMDDLEEIKLEMLRRAEGGGIEQSAEAQHVAASVSNGIRPSEEKCEQDDFERKLAERMAALRSSASAAEQEETKAHREIAAPQRETKLRNAYPDLSGTVETKPIGRRGYPEVEGSANGAGFGRPKTDVLTAGERMLNGNVKYDGFLLRDEVKYLASADLVDKFKQVAA
ncbi:hypothetical protein FOL47_008132 [Perkinsus chesapeaki]|uniref:Uncharacterized protein n=1 Tax=Perkinsus chesapeaki TaxID=330153 RepID=A0A7J6LGE2_PERCH|nr:hypothetical protein FOL47_008132 [Perkinsus chesapeaki]